MYSLTIKYQGNGIESKPDIDFQEFQDKINEAHRKGILAEVNLKINLNEKTKTQLAGIEQYEGEL